MHKMKGPLRGPRHRTRLSNAGAVRPGPTSRGRIATEPFESSRGGGEVEGVEGAIFF